MKHSRKVNQRGGARLDRSITLFQTQLLELNLEVEVLPNYRLRFAIRSSIACGAHVPTTNNHANDFNLPPTRLINSSVRI